MASGGAQLLVKHQRSRPEPLKHSDLGTFRAASISSILFLFCFVFWTLSLANGRNSISRVPLLGGRGWDATWRWQFLSFDWRGILRDRLRLHACILGDWCQTRLSLPHMLHKEMEEPAGWHLEIWSTFVNFCNRIQLSEDLPQWWLSACTPEIMALLGRYNKIKVSDWLRSKSLLLVLSLKYQEATNVSPTANAQRNALFDSSSSSLFYPFPGIPLTTQLMAKNESSSII